MAIESNREEKEPALTLLDREPGEIRTEIHHTKNHDY